MKEESDILYENQCFNIHTKLAQRKVWMLLNQLLMSMINSDF